MEVQKTTTEGKSVISDTLKLTYNIYVKGSKKELTGDIRKNDEIVGRFNASNNENSWSLYTAGSYRTTIRVSTRSCARTCSFQSISPFLPRGIGGPVGKVW